jgi:hypothetical protein
MTEDAKLDRAKLVQHHQTYYRERHRTISCNFMNASGLLV